MKQIRCILAIFLVAAFLFGAAHLFAAEQTEQVPPGLKAGQTVLFLGDSITHQCLYTRYIALFYMTRYPSTPLHFYNSGVGGDQAADAIRRFEYDVAALKPACVTVLLGMNDGWYRPLGDPQFARYRKGMTTLLDLLQKMGAKVFLLTPSMYDYATRKMRGRSGCEVYNDALIAFGRFLQELGKKRGVAVVDMNKPLVEATAALRKKDPKATLIPDGVHPDAAGHLVMAYTILKAFDVTPVVSIVTIDAKTRTAKASRAKVASVAAKDGALEFDVTENALPFPYRDDARKVLTVLPFTEKMNREIIQVQNLPDGRYRLEIDGKQIGEWTAAELAKGVNLADVAATPQHAQAVEVMKVNDERTAIMHKVRNFRLAEKRRGYPNADGTYPRPLRKRIRTKDGKIKWVPDPEAEKVFDQQKKELPNWLKEIRELEAKAYKIAQPVPHHYRVAPAK